MRKQYHFRPSERGLLAWDVGRLVELARDLAPRQVAVDSICELDEPYWFGSGNVLPTCRAIAEHAQLIQQADLSFPIILSSDGRVMDGMHRVARAAMEERETIGAVRFENDPPPDYVGREPEDLPY